MTKIMPLRRLITSLDNGTWGDEPIEDGTDIYCVRAADFNFEAFTIKLDKAPLRSIPLLQRRRLALRPGDLVLEKSGGGEHQPVGRAVAYRSDAPAVCSNFAARLRAAAEVLPDFLVYLLASLYWSGATLRCIKQTTGIQNLDTDSWLETRVMRPPLDDQRRIAAFLDDQVARINQAIALRARQVQLIEDTFQSAWSRLIEDFFESDRSVALRRVTDSITDGPFGSSLTSSHYSDTGTRVIRLGDIGHGRFRDGEEAYISDEYAVQLKQHAAIAGDLIVAGLGDETWRLGRAAVVSETFGRAIVKADCYRLRLNASCSHNFAAIVLSSLPLSRQAALLSRGSTRARLNTEVVREINIPLPPLHAQHRAAHIWDNWRRDSEIRIALLRNSEALMKERRRSLITAAVTGEFDVSAASARALVGVLS